MEESFRLLHISDLHVAPSTYFVERGKKFLSRYSLRNIAEKSYRPANLPLLKAVARAAYENRPLDAILITGDLANWGNTSSLTAASMFIASKAVNGWHDSKGLPTLHGTSKALHLLPGNHDRYNPKLLGYGGSGGSVFENIFREYWNIGQGVKRLALSSAFGIVMGDLTLATVFHATSVEGSWGQGKAYIERIDFMKAQTELLRYEYPGLAVIWAVHFAPAFKDLEEELLLIDEGLLIEAAQDSGIRYLLCGHTHEHRTYRLGKEGALKVFCVGSASQRNEHRNTLNLFEIKAEDSNILDFKPTVLEFTPGEGFVSKNEP